MSTTVVRINTIMEVPPSGGSSSMPHLFRAKARGSGVLLRVRGEPVILVGDEFENEAAPDHRIPKTGGSFARTPSGRGKFTHAGQRLLRVSGKAVVTRAGQLQTCNDVGPLETSCRAATAIDREPLVSSGGSEVLTGT